MADVTSAIRTYILNKPAVADIIGQRMYVSILRQNCQLPAATIRKVSESHAHKLSDRTGNVATRLQIDCYSKNYLTTASIAETIYRSGIAALKGVYAGLNIRGVMIEDGRREWELFDPEGGDDHTYVAQFDLMVSYLEI